MHYGGETGARAIQQASIPSAIALVFPDYGRWIVTHVTVYMLGYVP